jgi:uncharacterized protein (UPF0335 family)
MIDNPDELRQYVAQVEQMNRELEAIQTDKSELYKAAKGAGYDVAVIKRVIAERRKEPSQRDTDNALFEVYWDAVTEPALAPARERAA